MDTIYWAALLSFIAGACGYVITRFWIIPIGRYRRIKQQLIGELQTYCQKLPTDDHAKLKPAPDDARLRLIRQLGMQLVAVHSGELPYWYQLVLITRKESPQEASDPILRLEKMPTSQQARQCIAAIGRQLAAVIF
ncbi:MAG: hypothetical protein WAU91_14890 [Desulfatitalea sp.]